MGSDEGNAGPIDAPSDADVAINVAIISSDPQSTDEAAKPRVAKKIINGIKRVVSPSKRFKPGEDVFFSVNERKPDQKMWKGTYQGENENGMAVLVDENGKRIDVKFIQIEKVGRRSRRAKRGT